MKHWGIQSIDRAVRLVLAAVLALTTLLPAMAVPAQAADDRSLYIYYTHTKETARITFKRNGRYVQEGLNQLNVFLRDWRRNEPANMDPALFDLLWEAYRMTGSSQPIHVVSAYRAPATNAMLRSTSSGVAENSQHTHGKAIDFYIPGVPTATLREIGFRLQVGGVGYYPTSGSPFVHLDTGSVRAWPRMTTAQLRNIFPDGRTLHLGSDGTVLSQQGRQVAQAEWERCGRIPCNAGAAFGGGSTQVANSGGGQRRTLMDVFFGGGADEELDAAEGEVYAVAAASPAPSAPSAAPVRQAPAASTQVASAPVEAPIPPARPTTLVAMAEAAEDVPPQIPFQVIDGDTVSAATIVAEAPAGTVDAPTPLARPSTFETLVAEAGSADVAVPAETASQAIAELDGLPLTRPDFDSATVMSAYAPQPDLAREIDSAVITAAIPTQIAALPAATGATAPLSAQGLRPASADPASGLDAFASIFQGPIVHAGGTPRPQPAAAEVTHAMASVTTPEGALFAPDLGTSDDMFLAAEPISGGGFGALMAPATDAGTPTVAVTNVAMSAELLATLPRFGAPSTIWVRLE